MFFRTGNEEDDTIECCIKAMFLNYYKHRKYYDKMLKHLVSCLFVLLLRNYNKYYIPDKNSQKELKIMRYLQEHYADANAGTCGGILQLQYVVFQQNGKAQYRV